MTLADLYLLAKQDRYTYDGTWEERLHPRNGNGRFTRAPDGKASGHTESKQKPDYKVKAEKLAKAAASQKLSDSEVEALKQYKTPRALVINKVIREGKVRQASKEMRDTIANMSLALERSKTPEDVKVFRTSQAEPELLDAMFSNKNQKYSSLPEQKRISYLKGLCKKGVRVSLRGFTSTTLNEGYQHYKADKDKGRINMTIDVPKGSKGMYIEDITGAKGKQAEFLLQRDTTISFKSIDFNPRTNEYTIHAEVKNGDSV